VEERIKFKIYFYEVYSYLFPQLIVTNENLPFEDIIDDQIGVH